MKLSLSLKDKEHIDYLLAHMSLDEKIGQVQCINAGAQSDEALSEAIEKYHVGAIFVGNMDKERMMEISRLSRKSRIPMLINGDFVNGVGARIDGLTGFPQQMACASADDEKLVEEMGIITAEEGNAYGATWTFGPVSDLCYNLQNPMMHVRTSGDNPERVLATSRAFIRGVQKNRSMAATAKHFPGDGLDARDTHLTTLINSSSREEWDKSYGVIWRGLIADGVLSIMSGHIALPCIDSAYEDPSLRYKGPRPASLSRKILIDFLRGELGFDGLIVTDAINMVGLGAHIKRDVYAERLLEAGNDMLLWTKPKDDGAAMAKAIKEGCLAQSRLDDAVRRVLTLKAQVGLFSSLPDLKEVAPKELASHAEVAQRMADKSIALVRDVFHALPLKNLKKGDRVLTITMTFVEGVRNRRDADDLVFVDEELEKKGFVVDHMVNPSGLNALSGKTDAYSAIFVNFKYPPKYGSIRVQGDATETLKGSWWVEDPRVVFTAFGDPFKIFDFPSLHSYVCTFSIRPPSQKAVVRAWLGEIPFAGSCPVNLADLLWK